MTTGPARRTPADRSGETWNLVYRFAQHWRATLLLCAALAAVGYLYARRYQPIYHAEVQVRVGDSLAEHMPGQKEDQTADNIEMPENLANAFRARFLVEPKLRALLQKLAKEPALAHVPELQNEHGREDLIEHIKGHALVDPITRRVYKVSYEGHDPDLVQQVVQGLSELGVADVIDQKTAAAREARAFLSRETEATRQKMLEAETEVVRFLRAHPGLMLTSSSEAARQKLGLQVADKLLLSREKGVGLTPLAALEASSSPEVRQLLNQRAELEAKVAQIEAAQKFDPVQTKIAEIERLQQQLSELKSQNYTPEYPEYQRVTRDIERLQQEIREHKSRRDKGLAADMRALTDARTQIGAIDRQIALLRKKAATGGKAPVPDERAISAEAEYARLSRDMEGARGAYEKLHERELEAQVNEELSKVKGNLAARIEEPAKRPMGPRGVSRSVMEALCVMVGFGFGLLLGALRALTDPRIYTVFDLARASKLPVLGRVPARDGPAGSISEVSDEATPLPAETPRERSERLGERPPEPFAREPHADNGERAATPEPRGLPPSRPAPPHGARSVPPPVPGPGDAPRERMPAESLPPRGDYMVVYSAPRTESGPYALPGRGTAVVLERSRSGLIASPQSAAFRLAAMGHVLHQGRMPDLPQLFLHSAPDGARAEQYRLLRCRLQDLSDPRVLVVTSALRGEGKTVAALNLALAYAEGGAHSVVLIDAHLGAPRLTELLGAEPRAEALSDPEWSGSGLHIWQYAPNLFLVPALGPRARRSAVLSSPAFAMVLGDLRQSFDYVIIDAPAVASSADAKIVLPGADAGLFLTRARRTTGKAVNIALDRLGRRAMAGVVLNEFHDP